MSKIRGILYIINECPNVVRVVVNGSMFWFCHSSPIAFAVPGEREFQFDAHILDPAPYRCRGSQKSMVDGIEAVQRKYMHMGFVVDNSVTFTEQWEKAVKNFGVRVLS